MKQFLKDIWKYIIPLIIGVILGILINLPSCQKQPETIIEYKEVHDTVTIDSIRIQWKTKPVNVYLVDTFYVKESGDTVKLDSLPITEYQYKDTVKTDTTSTEMAIYYSGFNASLDSIWLKHNYFKKQTTVFKERKKIGLTWAIGPSIGYSIVINPANGTINHGISGGVTLTVGIGGIIK